MKVSKIGIERIKIELNFQGLSEDYAEIKSVSLQPNQFEIASISKIQRWLWQAKQISSIIAIDYDAYLRTVEGIAVNKFFK
jgi:hypothetical protein